MKKKKKKKMKKSAEYYYFFRVWCLYMMVCETCYIPRSGFIASGITDETFKRPSYDLSDEERLKIYRKTESDAEHMLKSTFLHSQLVICNAYAKLPDLYPFHKGEKAEPENGGWRWFRDQVDPCVSHLVMTHDVGETVLGDQLDDGSGEHENSRDKELDYMRYFFSYYPEFLSKDLETQFDIFEKYGKTDDLALQQDLWDSDVAIDEIAFAKAVDKAEAVAFQLFLYTKGSKGDIAHKNPPSKRDSRFARILGTARSPDIYALGYRVATKHLDKELLRPIDSFLKVAFEFTFDKVPDCMTIDVSDIELDLPEERST